MKTSFVWQLGIAIPFALGAITLNTLDNYSLAQLTPDNTLGAENSIVTPQQLRDLIQGGAIRGNALFHSFDEFNVGSDRGVFFDLQNNTDILNIFTRVTGGNVSNILGTLGILQDALNSNVLGNANLFLLNPNGITFGGNASLQLNGSFFATTADGFGFDNFTFSASGEEVPPPLLTVSIPRFASFRDNPGDIAVNQSNLSVNQGQNLSLLGGNVTVQGGQLNAPGGRIELGGMFVLGNVTINDNSSLTFPDVVVPDNFQGTATDAIDTGKVTINADTLNLNNGVQIVSQTGDSTELGGITINATDSVNVTGFSQIRTQTDGTGSAEGITINAPNILLDGLLNNNTRSSLLVGANNDSSPDSNAGNLELNTNIFNLSNGAQIQTVSFGAGNVGDLNINATEAVNFTNDGRLISQVRQEGSVGNITINSPSITIDTASRILPQVGTFVPNNVAQNRQATGSIGNLQIDTQNLTISNGGRIIVRTYGPGSLGNTTINADQVSITGLSQNFGSRITLQVGNGTGDPLVSNRDSPINVNTTGSVGRLQINTRILNVGEINSQSDVFGNNDGRRSQIQALTWGAGNIGDNVVDSDGNSSLVSIEINATESVTFNARSFIFAETRASGDVGNITVDTPSMSFNENSLIFSRTGLAFERDADVNVVTARERRIIADNEFATGDAGDIILNVATLSLTHSNPVFSSRDGSKIQSQTFAAGTAGDIIINATESISVSSDFTDLGNNRRSLIFSDFVSQVDTENRAAGSITIDTPSLSLDNNTQINANTRGIGNAGDININADRIFLQNESLISSSSGFDFRTQLAGNGDAGSITIQASESISLTGNSQINTSVTDNATGNGGNITLTVPDLSIRDGSFVRASTSSQQNSSSNAGSIDINVSGNVTIDGEGSGVRANTSAILGNGDVVGNINLSATNLTITDGGSVQAITFGNGNAGSIKIDVSGTVMIDGAGSGVFASTQPDSTGNSGSIDIDPEQVIIQNGGLVSVNSQGDGLGGDINITSDTLILDNGRITANTANDANGNITLNISDYIFLLNGNGTLDDVDGDGILDENTSLALISANSQGDGGNITIGRSIDIEGNITQNTVALIAIPGQDSDITANSVGGSGGRITIGADALFNIQASDADSPNRNDITATSQLGSRFSGQVIFNTPETNPGQETIEQPEEVADESDIISQSVCRDFGGGGQLRNTGRSGMSPTPELAIRSEVVNVDLVDEVLLPPPPPEAIKPHHRTDVTFLDSEGEEFKPAMGAVLLPNGMVQFVDYSPAEVYRDMYAAAGCNN